MTPENPLAIDVAVRTTRGRFCPRCGGKIIPSDRAVYQSTGGPDAVFPIWQCERCGYEEMSAQPKTKGKVESGKAGKSLVPATGSAAQAVRKSSGVEARDVPRDLQGRPFPPDVLQLLERFKPDVPKDG